MDEREDRELLLERWITLENSKNVGHCILVPDEDVYEPDEDELDIEQGDMDYPEEDQ